MKKYLIIISLFLTLFSCRQASDVQSLQGQWRFALDPNDRGLAEQWQTRSLGDTIHLPGSL